MQFASGLSILVTAILLSLVCPIVLHKNDFNRRRVLNDLSVVDKVAGMDAKILAFVIIGERK